jgi:hypothetical protein
MKPHRPSAFADAVPVASGRGHRLPATIFALAQRDALLIEAARRFCPGASGRETARRLRIALSRYCDGRWRRERTEALCPPRHRGTITALLWELLKVRDHVPSERLIRLVLSR